MSDPVDLWRTQQNATFPPTCLPLAVDGVKLVKLDALAGAILTAALRTDGIARGLPAAKRDELRQHRELILRALAEVPLDPDGRAYFERLAFLSTHVLMAPG